MTQLKYGWVLSLIFWLAISKVYGQLESVEAHYRQLERQAKHEPTTLHFVQADANLVDDYAHLSQIILIRHGKPTLKHRGWKKRDEVMQYVIAYDSVGVYPPQVIPLSLAPEELTIIHTSSLNRSISTAQQVFGLEELLQPDTLFREFERKIFAFPNLKLPTRLWLTGSRILWFLGLNDKGIESRAVAKTRAQKAAGVLEEDAIKQGKTLLVAHGLLNRYLEKYLNRRGWKTVYDGGNGYFSQKMLVRYRL